MGYSARFSGKVGLLAHCRTPPFSQRRHLSSFQEIDSLRDNKHFWEWTLVLLSAYHTQVTLSGGLD